MPLGVRWSDGPLDRWSAGLCARAHRDHEWRNGDLLTLQALKWVQWLYGALSPCYHRSDESSCLLEHPSLCVGLPVRFVSQESCGTLAGG